MTPKSTLFRIFLGLSLSMICNSRATGQSAMSSTENEAWPEADVHVQLTSNWRVLSFVGLEQAAGYPFQQWYVAAGIGRQFKPILKPHRENIDPDKEHYLLIGGGYEYLRTTHSGGVSNENRLTFDMTFGLRPASKLLLRDRNWTEVRWINGNYSTTYRNMVAAEVDLRIHSTVSLPLARPRSSMTARSIPGTKNGIPGVPNFRIRAFLCWKSTTGASIVLHAPLKTGMQEV
jgi:hypothetical protein